ncbi:O-antigen ligase family protein [Fictibacillus nanhaiensis]|uniref:O-antigen ligase family protein n=1 Tax=Fictibacillus nanhaiensis TaxID=742169 RepID=UPI002E1BE96F|nr:O-antigen ligase family protein [Fictibacillus nanhaiensis]
MQSRLKFFKVLGINIVILGILAGIMRRYPLTDKVYYLFLLVLLLMLFVNIFRYNHLKISEGNMFSITVAVSSLVFMIIFSMDQLESVAKRYLIVYILIIYLYFSFLRYGLDYTIKFYKQLTYLLNTFSVLNLYQVFFHKPLLINYMELIDLGYNYHFGSFAYRTMSVFNHPIVCGLFFVIAFLCNIFVLKSPMKYFFQILLILNIYTTYARSAWLALAVIMIVYAVLNHKKILLLLVRPKITYTSLFTFCLITPTLFIFMIFNFEVIYAGIVERFGDSLSFNSSDGSNLQRTMTISLIWSYMFDNGGYNLFFGYGAGTVTEFMLKHPLLLKGFATTDNQYVTLFYEFGLIGIFFYIYVIFFITFKYFKNKNKHWAIDLSFLCLLVVSFELLFFEAWPVVLVILAFLISVLTFQFKKINTEQD